MPRELRVVRRLLDRQVEVRHAIEVVHPELERGFRHADHRRAGGRFPSHEQAAADGGLTGPDEPGEPRVDDGNPGRARAVPLREAAALLEVQARNAEVVLRHEVLVGPAGARELPGRFRAERQPRLDQGHRRGRRLGDVQHAGSDRTRASIASIELSSSGVLPQPVPSRTVSRLSLGLALGAKSPRGARQGARPIRWIGRASRCTVPASPFLWRVAAWRATRR